MRSPPLPSLALGLALLGPADLSAQSRAALRSTARDLGPPPSAVEAPVVRAPRPASAADETGSTPAVIGAGILGGAVGLVAGGYLGALLADGDGANDLDFLSGAIAGAAIGEGLLLPLGVHRADGGDGSYAVAALASLGLAGAGLLAVEAVHYDPPGAPIVAVAVPVAQIAAAIAIERATD